MNVYFIRHGESVLNKERVHQYDDTPLSGQGQEQARLLAERFANLDFDLLVTSTFTRARETAEIVNSKHNKKILESPLFAETKRPSEILGKKYDDPEARTIYEDYVLANRNKPDWRYSDEESFADLKLRARNALQFLIDHEAERIVVVTHGDILKLFLAFMQHGDDLTAELYHRFRHFAPTKNTGITICHHNDTKGWFLISFNDHAHLE